MSGSLFGQSYVHHFATVISFCHQLIRAKPSDPRYEKSETHRFEVPRMLFDNLQELEAYIMKSEDTGEINI